MTEKQAHGALPGNTGPSARRVIGGLPWLVSSPSYYRLAPEATVPGSVLDVSYLDQGEWLLVIDRGGEVATKLFTNRDHAFDMVATAFARM